MLAVISGLPGTGKTTVSHELAKELDARVLSTDKIRKGVLKEPRYTTRKKKHVYEEMFRTAQDLLAENENVILDATFFRKEWRDKASEIGRRRNKCVFFIEIRCPEEIVKKRMNKRDENKKDYSDADYRVYKIIQSKFEPMKREHFVIDTGKNEEWKKESLDVANKMRIIEKQDKIIDVLKENYKMELLQTHISWVLLDGHHAFKIKKPVRFSFVDYSSLRKRKHFCEKENEINARLSPELYLGVVPIHIHKNGSVTLNKKGKTVEYAVKMVELPQAARMDNLIKEQKAKQVHIERIAKILAVFHQRAKAAPKKYGSTKIIRENFSPIFKTKPVVEEYLQYGREMENIEAKVDSFIKKNKEMFAKRLRDNRIKRCHGDVRTKNIFIHKNKIFIFDSIEFSEKIASCDVAAEVAFLAMDLNVYDRKKWADILVEKYIDFSGDEDLIRLIDFYMCYRALVESLVETYTINDPEIGERKTSRAKKACKRYLDLASSFAKKIN
jgi:aminoglycoside phosphotransferase family enzyme/predicted kinase